MPPPEASSGASRRSSISNLVARLRNMSASQRRHGQNHDLAVPPHASLAEFFSSLLDGKRHQARADEIVPFSPREGRAQFERVPS
jgi:hypothetical protein